MAGFLVFVTFFSSILEDLHNEDILALLDNSDFEDNGSGNSENDESDEPGEVDDEADDGKDATVQIPGPTPHNKWKRKQHFHPSTNFTTASTVPTPEHVLMPIAYFTRYIPDSMCETMAEKTNMRYVKDTGRPLNTSAEEMKKFIGASIAASCIGVSWISVSASCAHYYYL